MKIKLPASYEVVISASQRYAVALGRNVACVDLDTGKRVGSWHPFAHPSSAAFNRSGTVVAVKNTSGKIACMRTSSGEVIASYTPRSHDEGAALHFSPDDEFVVDASWDGVINIRRAGDLALASSFEFRGEMFTQVSPSHDRMTWLFLHQPKAQDGADFAASPYLSLWKWPLVAPAITVASQFDNVYAAALSPNASEIALVGYRRRHDAQRIAIMSLTGDLLREAPTTIGGTGARTRWSPDGKLIGTVQDGAFAILEAASLDTRATIPDRYPSDVGFLQDGRVILGTWERGTITELNRV